MILPPTSSQSRSVVMILPPTSSLQQEWWYKNPSQVAKPRVMDFFTTSTPKIRRGYQACGYFFTARLVVTRAVKEITARLAQ